MKQPRPKTERKRWRPVNTETCPRLRIQHVCRDAPANYVIYKDLCAFATEASMLEQGRLERRFDRRHERQIRYDIQARMQHLVRLGLSVDMDALYYRRVSERADLSEFANKLDLAEKRQSRAAGIAAWDDDDRADRTKKKATAQRARNKLPVLNSVAAFLNEAGRASRQLSHKNEIDLAKRIEAGGPDGDRARDEMIRANLLLVVEIAKKYHGKGMSQLDLLQEGNIGLVTAVDRFDYRRGNRFSTFAWNWIRGGITRAFKKEAQSHFRPAENFQRQPLTNPTQPPTLSPEELREAENLQKARDDMGLGAHGDFDATEFDAGFQHRLRPTERA